MQFDDFTVHDPPVPHGRVLSFDGSVDLPDDGLVLKLLVDHKGEDGRLLRWIECERKCLRLSYKT